MLSFHNPDRVATQGLVHEPHVARFRGPYGAVGSERPDQARQVGEGVMVKVRGERTARARAHGVLHPQDAIDYGTA